MDTRIAEFTHRTRDDLVTLSAEHVLGDVPTDGLGTWVSGLPDDLGDREWDYDSMMERLSRL